MNQAEQFHVWRVDPSGAEECLTRSLILTSRAAAEEWSAYFRANRTGQHDQSRLEVRSCR